MKKSQLENLFFKENFESLSNSFEKLKKNKSRCFGYFCHIFFFDYQKIIPSNSEEEIVSFFKLEVFNG